MTVDELLFIVKRSYCRVDLIAELYYIMSSKNRSNIVIIEGMKCLRVNWTHTFKIEVNCSSDILSLYGLRCSGISEFFREPILPASQSPLPCYH